MTTTSRQDGPRIGRQLAGRATTEKLTMLVLFAAAMVATTVAHPAPSHADPGDRQPFQTPSGNIRCDLFTSDLMALCSIEDHSYVAPPGSEKTSDGDPCPGPDDPSHFHFRLDEGKPAYLTCAYSALNSGIGPWPMLDYGHTQSAGPITCDSEPAGVTCTDAGAGHFFRISRESYQLG